MLQASVLGSATSTGLLYQSRNPTGRPEARLFPSASSSSCRSLFASHVDGDGAEEEVMWYGQTVLWSRGTEVYRKYTFEEEGEDVAYATFAWFPIPAAGPSTIPLSTTTSTSTSSETFGPFQTSQHSIWGAPVLSQSSSTTHLARCFVVFLQTRAHVYFPSGRDVIVHLPFVVDGVWPLHTGGILVQRALEKREKRRMNRGKDVLRGMDMGNMSVLADLVELDEDAPSLPRLFTLQGPFDEFKMVVEGHVDGGHGGHGDGEAHDLSPRLGDNDEVETGMTVLLVSDKPYPFVILYDHAPGEIVFTRGVTVPLSQPAEPAALPSIRTARPEDILRPPEPPQIPKTKLPRPSLHRNSSSFGPSADRRQSGAADPLDRTTRRAPRMSRGAEVAGPNHGAELQATLDPAAHPVPAPPSKGKGRATTTKTSGETSRRQSGASSILRKDVPVAAGGMALLGASDKDLRETTMVMGLQREEGTRSEVVLDRIWVWKPPGRVDAANISVFLSDDTTPSSVHINVQLPTQLYTFLASRSQGSAPFTISPFQSLHATASLPILATRHRVHDTLVLNHAGSLELVTSGGRSLGINLPKIPVTGDGRDEVAHRLTGLRMVLEEDDRMGAAERRIMGLSDAVGSRYTVIFEDGEKLRISADFRIQHLLVRQCFEALSYVLTPEAFFSFKRELISHLEGLSSLERGDDVAPWTVFRRVLFAMIGIPLPVSQSDAYEHLLDASQQSADPVTRRLAVRAQAKRRQASPQPTPRQALGAMIDPTEIPGILLTLHLVAQDCRLSSSRQKDLPALATVLVELSGRLGRADWRDYWLRLVSSLQGKEGVPHTIHTDTSLLDRFQSPPDILVYLSRRLLAPTKRFPSPQTCGPAVSELGTPTPCLQTERICAVFDRLGPPSVRNPDSVIDRAASAVLSMVSTGLTADWVADLPYGLALPVLEMTRICQHSPGRDWPADAYEFVGRTDLAMQSLGQFPANDPTSEDELDKQPTVGELMALAKEGARVKQMAQPMLPHVRFGSDKRLAEVERIMQTTRARTISVHDPKVVGDQELVQYHQQMVNTIAQRTLAVTVGQGIFEYGTRQASITDSWDIPFIELSAKIVPANTTLRAQISADHADWPCFHNGVSAALSISPDSQGIDSSWIVFNRPREATAEHGGFLLGLGLTGHLRSLLPYHALSYLDLRNDFYSTGVLLGLACSHAGSEDLLITKALSLHTHALLPLGSMELNASPIIQSSALIGLGLVYAGSKNLRMAEVALSEVGRTTMAGVDNFGDYAESYSFSAAMAFGLTMLGRGGQVSSEVDRRLLAQLRRCILGDSPSLSETKTATAIPVDPHLTAPGATLALGLMYLKTNRPDIRNMLPLPQSALALEQVRPDLLLLRTFARALIMWDDISPTMGWIEDQLPAFILATHKMHKHVGGVDQASELAYLNILAGACFAVGLKYAGTATELAHNNLMTIYGILSKAAGGSSMTYEGRIRRTTARQALAVVALSLCVVMSGTGELNVLRRLRVSHGQEGNGVTYGTHMAMHMALGILFLGRGNYTLGNSNLAIAAMAIAFFPRFLSTPDDNKAYPQAFRHLWALAVEPRCLMARDVDSGEVVYLPVKIEWKEGATPAGVETQSDLNNGKTQSKSKTRTQSLISPTLIAPFDTLVSISVDSVRYWPITYDLSNPTHRAALVRTRTIHVKRKAGFLDYNSDPKGNRSIFVRAGSMTGFDMHYDLVSPAAPPALSPKEVLELVQAHSVDPIHTALVRYFAGERERAADAAADGNGNARDGNASASASASASIDAFVRTILLECVTLDKPGLIGVYLGMLLSVTSTSGDLAIEGARQLKMVRSFFDVADRSYSPSGEGRGEKKPPLVRPSFLSALERRASGENARGLGLRATSGRRTDAADEMDTSGAVEAELDPRMTYLAEGRWTGDCLALARWIEREGLPVLPLLSELAGRVRQLGQQSGGRGDEAERRVLEVRVREVVERYAEAVGSEYDAGNDQGGVGGGVGTRWKTESLNEAVGLWLGDAA